MKKTTALVFGGNGFIGRHLIERLVVEGNQVLAFVHDTKGCVKGVNYIVGDIRDPIVVRRAIKYKPDAIFLLAGISGPTYCDEHPDLSFSVNVSAQLMIAQLTLAHSSRSRLIFSSSRHEYGTPQYVPVDEQHPVVPLSYYGLHKSYVTQGLNFLHRKFGLKTTILRTANLYGPHFSPSSGHYNIINYFVDLASQNKEVVIFGRGKQLRDYIFIHDFVDLLCELIVSPQSIGQIYNIGSGKGTPLLRVAQLVVKHANKGKVVYKSWPSSFKAVETGDYISNIGKITSELGWKPKTDLISGIKKSLG